MAKGRSTFHSVAARITATVRIAIEMTYRRCRPRTSSARPVRAPVIRNTWPPSPCCFRVAFTRLTVRRARAADETGAPAACGNALGRTAEPDMRPRVSRPTLTVKLTSIRTRRQPWAGCGRSSWDSCWV
ncbi:hypothetical protein GPN2_12432 [Streptomyces murinus]